MVSMIMCIRKWLASFLLASITFLIVPPEFVHHYFHHFETEDDFFRESGHYIESKHQHCLILKVEIPEYVIISDVLTQTNVSYPKKLIDYYSNPLLVATHRNIDLRGPPQKA